MGDTMLLIQLLTQLIESDPVPGEIQTCPLCGGELHVGFEAYKRGKRSLLGATAECKTCDAGVATDCAGLLPPWRGQ